MSNKNTNRGADCCWDSNVPRPGYHWQEPGGHWVKTETPPPGSSYGSADCGWEERLTPGKVGELLDELREGPVSPSHYKFPGDVQVIDITRHLGFLEGNVIKYVARAGRKGDRREDLLKAKQYLDWLLEEGA